MDIKNEDAACEALIQWFRSQDISPEDSVPLMAKAMCAAVVSMVRGQPSPLLKTKQQKRRAIEEGVDAAAATVREAFEEMKGRRP